MKILLRNLTWYCLVLAVPVFFANVPILSDAEIKGSEESVPITPNLSDTNQDGEHTVNLGFEIEDQDVTKVVIFFRTTNQKQFATGLMKPSSVNKFNFSVQNVHSNTLLYYVKVYYKDGRSRLVGNEDTPFTHAITSQTSPPATDPVPKKIKTEIIVLNKEPPGTKTTIKATIKSSGDPKVTIYYKIDDDEKYTTAPMNHTTAGNYEITLHNLNGSILYYFIEATTRSGILKVSGSLKKPVQLHLAENSP
ncbi:hypothetical protein ACFL27_16835 [candidate division CSSED10-310 bacterium]|uniref:Fibronectin type-III domain-containing protein n=1 Tax=candidate division CSSED10-310 bacterium TaxID=2855610 RepID=A0ABV6Z087_UNCC1